MHKVIKLDLRWATEAVQCMALCIPNGELKTSQFIP